MINLKQKELHEWQERNFKGTKSTTKPEWCALGMAEEVGELCHLILKRKQGIRNYTDNDKAKELIADAFADVVVYGVQLMTCEGLDAEAIIQKTIDDVLKRDWRKDPVGGLTATKHKELREG